jgi:hypothetical protein
MTPILARRLIFQSNDAGAAALAGYSAYAACAVVSLSIAAFSQLEIARQYAAFIYLLRLQSISP